MEEKPQLLEDARPTEQDERHQKLKTRGGITLVPQPSDDLQDPLNWSASKKTVTTLIWCLGAFVGTASGLGNALGYFVQAQVYGTEPIVLSYSVIAALAGVSVAPLFVVPLGQKYGRSFLLFWCLIGLLASGIWSALMTQSDQYIPFVVARLFCGIFGGPPIALGTEAMIELFFLHQRGKVLAVFNLTVLFGVVMGPTFSGFILCCGAPWPVQFWWSNALEAVVLVLAFFFLHDTHYDRGAGGKEKQQWPKPFVANRMSTFFCGTRVMPRVSWGKVAGVFFDTILVGLSPVTLLAGAFMFIDFGFAAFFNVVLTVFLQNPIDEGGYAFTPTQNAAFLFCLWFGIFAAQLYGSLVNDRLPLHICQRRGGIWEPEYRLHAVWAPAVAMPIALGLYGASLQYHLHYMVLALANFLGGYASNAIVPIVTNYVIECFKNHASETAAILGLYRLVLSLPIPFFVSAWIASVGPGWALGMAGFFCVFAASFVGIVVWRGETLRQWSFKRVAASESGVHLITKEETQAVV